MFQEKLKLVKKNLGNHTGNFLKVARNMTRGRCRTFKFEEIKKLYVLKKIRGSPSKESFGIDEIS